MYIMYHYSAEMDGGLGFPFFDLKFVLVCPDNLGLGWLLSGQQRSAEMTEMTLIGKTLGRLNEHHL